MRRYRPERFGGGARNIKMETPEEGDPSAHNADGPTKASSGQVRGRARIGEISLSAGALSFKDINLGLEFQLPKSPEEKVQTDLRRFDGWLGLRNRAWWRGKRQKPAHDQEQLDEPQRDALTERMRYDRRLDRAVGEIHERLCADIMCRAPPHYTKEQINGFVVANWVARQDDCVPVAIDLARRVVETQDELRAFRVKHDLIDATPEDFPKERLGPLFFLVFFGEALLNALLYRSAFPDGNLMSAIALAIIFSLAIMMLAVSNGAYGIANIRDKDPANATLGKRVIILATTGAVALSVIYGAIRLMLPSEANAMFHRLESFGLTLLNLVVFGYVTIKFRKGFKDISEQFRRIWNAHHDADRRFNGYLVARLRWYMDGVLDYYRTQFLRLKGELKGARQPVVRAVAAFETIERNAIAAQKIKATDVWQLILTYRERNTEARRVFSFIGWLKRLRKTPPPENFSESLPDEWRVEPILSRTPAVENVAAEFDRQITAIEGSVDQILFSLGDLTAEVGANFDRFKARMLADARRSADVSKTPRLVSGQ